VPLGRRTNVYYHHINLYSSQTLVIYRLPVEIP